MSLFRRAKTLTQATVRPASPEPIAPGTPLTPVTVAAVSAAPTGRLTKFTVAGHDVAVARIGDAYFAVSDICSHFKCSLSEGTLEGTTVTCICHGSQFDVTTGGVLRGPAKRPIRTYAVRADGNDLIVDLPAGGVGLPG